MLNHEPHVCALSQGQKLYYTYNGLHYRSTLQFKHMCCIMWLISALILDLNPPENKLVIPRPFSETLFNFTKSLLIHHIIQSMFKSYKEHCAKVYCRKINSKYMVMACKIISLSVQLPAVQCQLNDSYSSNRSFSLGLVLHTWREWQCWGVGEPEVWDWALLGLLSVS